uniref:Mucin-17-like n=1 Tax=Petromyzon marinus TaxID=7757 RepID=A0AAJ7TJV2_PETMA|nr:mucin-17-like [Petromyzon marinus]
MKSMLKYSSSPDPSDICINLSNSSKIHLEAVLTDGRYICVTECHGEFGKLICQNGGQCKITPVSPYTAVCYCRDFYIGKHCESIDIGLVAGITVPLVVLLIATIVLTVVMIKRNKKKKAVKASVRNYEYPDEHWKGENDYDSPGSHDNPLYDPSSDKIEDVIPPGVFKPTLENVTQEVITFQRPEITIL